MDRNVIVFPGTTTPPRPGVLSAMSAVYPGVRELLADIDRVSAEFGGSSVAEYLLRADPPQTKLSPEEHYLSLMGASLSAFHAVLEEGLEPYAIVGQSIGELWACVASGGLSVIDGARLACSRSTALTQFAWPGAMMPISQSADRVSHLVELIDHPHFVIAGVNSPHQTVVSGPRDLMPMANDLADRLGWATTILDVPHASHNPAVLPAAAAFVKRVPDIQTSSLRWRIFSPTLRRWITEDDHPVQLVANAISHPVHFYDALSGLAARGASGLIHCGAIEFVETLLRDSCPSVPVTTPLLAPADLLSQELSRFSTRRGDRATTGPRAEAANTHISSAADLLDQPQESIDIDTSDSALTGPASSRREILDRLRRIYADQLGYPEEVLTDTANLERDLGVESIRQIQLLKLVAEEFSVEELRSGVRVLEYTTLSLIADKVVAAAASYVEVGR